MKKRLGFLVLAIILALTSFGSVVLANSEKVEVEFCVGDDTLMINGEAVVVEKPYVVGAGVTLVPLRVITEAFGAQVEWIGETKTIILTYPDVNIVLQIDNPVAEINGRAETLLAAPELTSNGYTMVPLRFISENFGATVSYEAETERITVVKEISASVGSTVEGAIESKYVGDSYYGWYMENPSDMHMSTRRFDGRQTVFVYDENNSIDISVYNIEKDFDFEKEFAEIKASTQGLTLVKADKDAENKIMHFQVKDKTVFYDMYNFASDKYVYSVIGVFDNENTELKDECTGIIATFSLGFNDNETYDLSNVKDGVRKFEVESMGFSIDIPTEFIMISDPESLNEFEFNSGETDDETSAIVIGIYSRDSVGGAEKLAAYDMTRNKNRINEKISEFSEGLKRSSYKNIYSTVYEYEYELNGTHIQLYARDVFFEIGDYVYNISVIIELSDDKKIVDNILNSFDASEIDSSVVGSIIYNLEDAEGTFTSDVLTMCSFEIPNSYTQLQATSTAVVYNGISAIFSGNVYTYEEDYEFSDVEHAAAQYAISQAKTEGREHIKTANEKLGEKTYVIVTVKSDTDDETGYIESYYTVHKGKAYVFNVLYSELTYSEYTRNEVINILKSAVYK